jgi:electron transfer flavoprotein beta subunit
VYLVSDRKFGGADTLATSYVLSEAIKKIGSYDLILAGRQAIDGDTAQVGPQTAEKLDIPQVTYVEGIQDISKKKVTLHRHIDGGTETVESGMPLLLTVIKDAAEPRPFKAKRVMAYKNAKSLVELEKMSNQNSLLYMDDLLEEYTSKGWFIETFTMDELDVDPARVGLHGSPTKVHKVDSVVLAGGGHESIEPTREGMNELVDKLMEDHILG